MRLKREAQRKRDRLAWGGVHVRALIKASKKVLWLEVQAVSVMWESLGHGHTNTFKILFDIYSTDEKPVGRPSHSSNEWCAI